MLITATPIDNTKPRRKAIRASCIRVFGRVVCAVLCAGSLSGCAAFHPIQGIPARYLPHEYKGQQRTGHRTIDLSLLRQTPPEEYLLDSGDVLGLYIEGVLGQPNQVPPVYFPQDSQVPPSVGYPVPIRDDGTISLPLIDPIQVRGMTISQVEETLRKAYTVDRQILRSGRDRILVSLQRPRTYRILVLRQEGGLENGNRFGFSLGNAKRGTGQVVSLPAYENDVLHAITETGGLPGLDAENAIYIIRQNRKKRPPAATHVPTRTDDLAPGHAPAAVPPPAAPPVPPSPGAMSPLRVPHSIQQTSGELPVGHTWPPQAPPTSPLPSGAGNRSFASGHSAIEPQPSPFSAGGFKEPYDAGQRYWNHFDPEPHNMVMPDLPKSAFTQSLDWNDATMANRRVIRIPVRLAEGQRPRFRPDDIVLHDGDVVFIESRETEIFYTGGLLGGGQFTLPRDYDLDVLGAVSIAQGQGQFGGFGGNQGASGVSALNQDVTISASQVVILRQMPNGTQLPIRVNLYKAVRNPAERVLIQPGDYVILQYTPIEAVAAFFERHILQSAIFGIAASQINN